MKLCSICDRKVEGTWCKTCKRFVKTYDISDSIHLNESHDLKNDANCSYHMTTKTRTSTAGTTNRPNQTVTRSTTSSRTNQQTQKNSKKIVKTIVIVYFVLVVAGFLVSFVASGVFDDIGKEKREEEKVIHTDRLTPEEDEEWYNEPSISQILLQTVKPVGEETDEETGYKYQYYDLETIKKLAVACDEAHFDYTVEEFDSFLEQWFGDSEEWDIEEVSYPETNYLCEKDEEKSTYFGSKRRYSIPGALVVDVFFDTSTGDLHQVLFNAEFVVTTANDYYAVFHALLQILDSEYNGSKLSFARKVERVAREKTGEDIDVSDQVMVYAELDNFGELSIMFYPKNY